MHCSKFFWPMNRWIKRCYRVNILSTYTHSHTLCMIHMHTFLPTDVIKIVLDFAIVDRNVRASNKREKNVSERVVSSWSRKKRNMFEITWYIFISFFIIQQRPLCAELLRAFNFQDILAFQATNDIFIFAVTCFFLKRDVRRAKKRKTMRKTIANRIQRDRNSKKKYCGRIRCDRFGECDAVDVDSIFPVLIWFFCWVHVRLGLEWLELKRTT